MCLNIIKIIYKFDNYILSFVKNHVQNKYLDVLMPRITAMGDLGAIWIVIVIFLSLGNIHKKIWYIVMLTIIVSTIIGEGIIKNIVKRVRPCNKYNCSKLLIPRPLSYSFPSGHTFSSFAAAEMLSVYYPSNKFVFMAIAILIALSRLYLYVHYPTDIIAGIILGTLVSKLILDTLQTGCIKVPLFMELYSK